MVKKSKSPNKASLLSINLNELEREWTEQPVLYFKWARKLSKARLRLDEAKAELELVKADLDSEIRAKPEKFDLDKVTNPAVEAAVMASEQYTDALTKLNRARYNANTLEAFVQALEHRKRALENCVTLYGMDYFSIPRAKGKGRDAKHKLDQRSARGGYRSDE